MKYLIKAVAEGTGLIGIPELTRRIAALENTHKVSSQVVKIVDGNLVVSREVSELDTANQLIDLLNSRWPEVHPNRKLLSVELIDQEPTPSVG